jgi:hypothetical protein
MNTVRINAAKYHSYYQASLCNRTFNYRRGLYNSVTWPFRHLQLEANERHTWIE